MFYLKYPNDFGIKEKLINFVYLKLIYILFIEVWFLESGVCFNALSHLFYERKTLNVIKPSHSGLICLSVQRLLDELCVYCVKCFSWCLMGQPRSLWLHSLGFSVSSVKTIVFSHLSKRPAVGCGTQIMVLGRMYWSCSGHIDWVFLASESETENGN